MYRSQIKCDMKEKHKKETGFNVKFRLSFCQCRKVRRDHEQLIYEKSIVVAADESNEFLIWNSQIRCLFYKYLSRN